MTPDFTIRKGDLEPPYYFQLLYSSGAPVDLSGATVKMEMWLESGGTTPKIDTSSGITITDAPNGKGNYAWSGTDTDTPGNYDVYMLVTFASGRKMSCPNLGFSRVKVTDTHE